MEMTLDAELYPSISYFFGWREHRYRYYYYYPEYTPDFSLLDEKDNKKDQKKQDEADVDEAAVSEDEEEVAEESEDE